MLQVPNPTEYKGLVIAKRRMDEPVTDEPIVYAYARIVPERRPVIASEVVLGLAENKDRANRYFYYYYYYCYYYYYYAMTFTATTTTPTTTTLLQ